MIVIGVDVHKHSLTAVAVDEVGRPLASGRCASATTGCSRGRRSLGGERLWALEDCRHLTRGLEQALLAAGERLVRVPPRLTAPQRRAAARAASRTRSTRSRSPVPLCRSHDLDGLGRTRRRCGS